MIILKPLFHTQQLQIIELNSVEMEMLISILKKITYGRFQFGFKYFLCMLFSIFMEIDNITWLKKHKSVHYLTKTLLQEIIHNLVHIYIQIKSTFSKIHIQTYSQLVIHRSLPIHSIPLSLTLFLQLPPHCCDMVRTRVGTTEKFCLERAAVQ